jgi:hypothetical protein
MRRWHWFRFVSNGIVALFFGIMIYVIVIAFTRQSGSTGLDMGSIQKMRYEAQQYSKILPSPTPDQ